MAGFPDVGRFISSVFEQNWRWVHARLQIAYPDSVRFKGAFWGKEDDGDARGKTESE